ncbi:MAG: hypothetical protein ACI9DC_001678 [Gammaproteobacteria bacterium]|jgi:hypothetical protein
MKRFIASVLGVGVLLGASVLEAEDRPIGFFITSVGPGNGGDLGGLECADNRKWRAYLSTASAKNAWCSPVRGLATVPGTTPRVISSPPSSPICTCITRPSRCKPPSTRTVNASRVVVTNPMSTTSLTGTQADGTPSFPRDKKDHTWSHWTSSGEGSAQVGHHDRHGGGNTSWNSAHGSRGCGQEALTKTGGAGKFYCFAAD